MKTFFFATIFGLNFSSLSIGVREEIRRNILPLGFRCCFACSRNFMEISSPLFPPVVASRDGLGSLLSNGR